MPVLSQSNRKQLNQLFFVVAINQEFFTCMMNRPFFSDKNISIRFPDLWWTSSYVWSLQILCEEDSQSLHSRWILNVWMESCHLHQLLLFLWYFLLLSYLFRLCSVGSRLKHRLTVIFQHVAWNYLWRQVLVWLSAHMKIFHSIFSSLNQDDKSEK